MLFVNISSIRKFISLVLNEASTFPYSIYVTFFIFINIKYESNLIFS